MSYDSSGFTSRSSTRRFGSACLFFVLMWWNGFAELWVFLHLNSKSLLIPFVSGKEEVRPGYRTAFASSDIIQLFQIEQWLGRMAALAQEVKWAVGGCIHSAGYRWKCPWARYWNPQIAVNMCAFEWLSILLWGTLGRICSWWTGLYLAWLPLSSVEWVNVAMKSH